MFGGGLLGFMSGGGTGTGQIVAFRDSSTSAGYSSAGTSWTGSTLAATAGILNQGRLCAWNGTLYALICANGASIQTSTDGINFTDRGSIGAGGVMRSICWNGSTFCIVGGNSNEADATKQCWTSADGVTWTRHTMPAVAEWTSLCWTGTQFVAIAQDTLGGGGVSNKAATSPDGTTWTARTLPASKTWKSIAWNGTTLVAVANSGVAATSTDGVTWTSRTHTASFPMGLSWNGTVFCFTDDLTQDSFTSPDGATWTKHASALPSSADWRDICWNGTVFVIVAQSGTSAATSPDGTTWTARTLPSSGSWSTVAANWLQFGTY